jgi:hypothetical protein
MDAEDQAVGLTYKGKPRTWGLRFSKLDGVVLVLATVITVATWSTTVGWSALVLFVVLHFFLFCNVFRIRRTPELVWAAIFITNCIFWVLVDRPNAMFIAASQLPATLAVICNELLSPYYHGIFARRINPRLDDYLADRVVSPTRG